MSVLDLEDVKAYLRIEVDTYDDELQATLDAAEAAIANRVGPLAPETITRRVAAGSVLILPVAPAVSLTAIADQDGTTVDTDTLYFNAPAGIISGSTPSTRFSQTAYDVTYVAGWETLPADLVMAVMELVRHLWQGAQRASGRPIAQLSETVAGPFPGAGYLLPNRVNELIAPHIQPRVA